MYKCCNFAACVKVKKKTFVWPPQNGYRNLYSYSYIKHFGKTLQNKCLNFEAHSHTHIEKDKNHK